MDDVVDSNFFIPYFILLRHKLKRQDRNKAKYFLFFFQKLRVDLLKVVKTMIARLTTAQLSNVHETELERACSQSTSKIQFLNNNCAFLRTNVLRSHKFQLHTFTQSINLRKHASKQLLPMPCALPGPLLGPDLHEQLNLQRAQLRMHHALHAGED